MGDLDGNGRDEIVVDFGWAGIWVWVNSAVWLQIQTGTTASGLAVSDFN